MEIKAKLDMEHGFMQSIIKNQVDRLINLKLLNIFIREFVYFLEGVVCGTLHRREQDDHALCDQKDLHVLFHQCPPISPNG